MTGVRLVIGAAAVLAVLAGVAGAGHLAERVRLGSAFFAKTLCSGVFVKGWDSDRVIGRDILPDAPWGLRHFSGRVDRRANTAEASLFGLAERKALFRPGLGCTLVNDSSIEALRAQTRGFAARTPPIPADRPWPEGDQATTDPLPAAADGDRLARAVDAAFAEPDATNLRRTRAVVVVHGGRIVAERYGAEITPDTPLHGWSLAKAAVNALTGLTVGAGTLQLRSASLLARWSGAGDPRAAITIDDLLRMSSGLDFEDPSADPFSDTRTMLFLEGDVAGYAARKPALAPPGTTWLYAGASTVLLCKVLQKAWSAADEHAFAFPRVALFDRIGMRSAVLEPDAAGTFVGSAFMYATARDWARLGLLYLRDGVWRGTRLLPAGWVADSVRPTAGSNGEYGAHFWLRIPAFLRPERAPAIVLPADAFYMLGHEGQMVAIVPSRDLVVVRLGLSRRRAAWDSAAFLADVLSVLPTAGEKRRP